MSLPNLAVRIGKYCLITLLSVVVFLLLSISFLAFTHIGNQAIITVAKKFESRLNIELVEGSVLNSPVFKDITWLDGDTNINIGSLDYQFDWSCLTTRLCLKSLNIDGAQISLAEPSDEIPLEVEQSSAPIEIDIPFEIVIEQVKLTTFIFSMGELAVNLQEISLQANAFHKDVSLSSQISGLLITLPNSHEQSVKTKATKPSALKKPVNLNFDSLPAILTKQVLPTVELPINLKVQPILLSHFKVLQNEQSLFELNKLETAFSFEKTQLTINQFELQLPETALQLSGKIDFVNDYPLQITIDGTVKKIKQLQPNTLLHNLNYNFSSEGSLSDLNSSLTLSNKLNLQLKSHLNLFEENLPHELDLKWQNLQWPLTGSAQYTSEQGSFTSRGSLLDHQIQLQTDYALTDLPSGKISLQTKGDLQQLQVESLKLQTLSGEIDFSGLLTWQDDINWLGQLQIKNIDLQQLETTYDGQFSGHIKQQATIRLYENHQPEWLFDFPELSINGKLLTRPLSVAGRVSGDNKQGINFDKLKIQNADNSFVVNGQLAEQNNLDIDLDIVDISHLLIGSKGKIHGNVHLSGPQSAMNVSSTLDAQEVQYEHYKLSKLALHTKIALSERPQVELELNASELSIDKQIIEKVKLKVANKETKDNFFRHQIKLLLNSELASSDLTLFLTQTETELLAELNRAKLSLPHQTLTLSAPFELISTLGSIEISPHCWQARSSEGGDHEAGKLCINQLNIGESGRVIFDIDRYLLTNINPFLPEQLKMNGAISADADFKWQANANPNFAIKLFSDDMLFKINSDQQSNQFTDYPMEKFNINLQGNDDKVVVEANIFAQDLINVKANADVFPYQNIPTIESKVGINLPNFSLFLPLITQLDKLNGQLSSQLAIAGKIQNPTVNGQVNINNVHLSSTRLPMVISELNAGVEVNNTQAKIQGSFNSSDTNTIVEKAADIPLLTNTLNIFDKSIKKVGEKIAIKTSKQTSVKDKDKLAEGVAHISGQFDWSNKLNGDLHFYANKLEIYDYGKIDLLVSPDVHLQVNEQINVYGKLYIDKGKIVVKELPAGAVTQSKDIIVVDIEKKKVAADLPVAINISVDTGNKFRVVALGLDTFINGDLLIKKQAKGDLAINGELKFVDGSYRSLGQQLVLQKSSVIFQGVPESPYLKIEAIRDPSRIEDNVIAGVRVTGTPDELELVIFSEPAMAQQEALSYLTRGQSLDSSSDSGTMANMLIDIAAGQSGNLMSSIGEGVGIKDLSLSSSGTGDEQSVGVRGEIAPGVEVSYGVGVFDTFSIFSIRYEVFERFYIEASSSLYQAVDAYYEWDWD